MRVRPFCTHLLILLALAVFVLSFQPAYHAVAGEPDLVFDDSFENNTPPVADNDEATVDEDSADNVIDVLDGDFDAGLWFGHDLSFPIRFSTAE